MNIISWVIANWAGVLAGLVAIYVALRDFAKITPTTKDDELFDKVEGIMRNLGWRPPPPKV